MAWKYKEAKKRGKTVRVLIEEASNPENIQTKDFTWAFNSEDGMNQEQFKTMIKGEIKAHLAHLNKTVVEDDVTNEFKPND